MELKLTNPIIFFDLESTGLDIAKDRIVEISLLKVFPDGTEKIKTLRINPGVKMPADAFAIHHISDEDVKDCPKFADVAKELAKDFEGCDLAGYNSSYYDLPLLVEEFLRAGVDLDFSKSKMVDVQAVFHKMEPRNLSAAYKFYCNKELNGAHGAEADTVATYEVLKAQLDKYPDLKNDVNALAKFTANPKHGVDFAGRIVMNSNGQEVFNFGKYKGRAVEDVLKEDPKYYSWMQEADFPLDTKRVLTRIRLRGLMEK